MYETHIPSQSWSPNTVDKPTYCSCNENILDICLLWDDNMYCVLCEVTFGKKKKHKHKNCLLLFYIHFFSKSRDGNKEVKRKHTSDRRKQVHSWDSHFKNHCFYICTNSDYCFYESLMMNSWVTSSFSLLNLISNLKHVSITY